jgi:L-aspartate oxidase
LRHCKEHLEDIASRLPPGATEERNMVDTAHLIAEAALIRKESRGGHFRRDFPKEKRKWRGKHIEW